MEEGSELDRTVLTALLCIGLIILAKRRFNWANAIKENIWVMLLIVYMLVSCLWSDSLFISLKRWSKELVAVVMAFVIVTEPDSRKALESLFRRIIYITIPFSYLLINYFPEYGRMYVHHQGLLMWTGVALHKNGLAHLCLFAAFFLIWTFIRRQQGRYTPVVSYQTILEAFILILIFWLWGGPQHTFMYSATATFAFALGLSAFIGLSLENKMGTMLGRKVLIALIAFIIIYGTVTPMVGKLSIIDMSSMLGREETLTGRADVWRKLVPAAMSRPILGYGFGGFWTTAARAQFQISEGHNGYLDLILSLGFVGLMLFAIFLLSSARKAQQLMTEDFDWGALWICYLLMTVILNITESSLGSFTAKMMAVIFLMTTSSTTFTSNSQEASLNGS